MTFILFLIITSSRNVPTVVQTQNFRTEMACLKAIEKIIDTEKKNDFSVTAFCIKD
jgi:hypothetical protein